MAIDKFPYIFKKFVKSPIALMTRNQISTWPMWKSDFFSLVQLVISRIFWKCIEIFQWPSLILTHTGIRDFRMSRMSGIEISLSQGLKKPPKISPREEKLSSQGLKKSKMEVWQNGANLNLIFAILPCYRHVRVKTGLGLPC